MSHSDAIWVRGIPTHPPTMLLLALVGEVALSVGLGRGPITWAVQLTGAALVIGGIALNVTADRGFHRSRTPVRPGARATTLVTDGVYAHTRNPMYLGMVLILVGAALALAAPWALVVPPLFTLWVDRLIRWEERRLDAAFGEAYGAYRRRVRRWL